MSTTLDPAPTVHTTVSPGRLTHLVCPTLPLEPPQTAICGYVCHTNNPHGPRCVVCLDLASQPCPTCGDRHNVEAP